MIIPLLLLAQIEFPATIVVGPGTTTIRISITIDQPSKPVIVVPPVDPKPIPIPALSTTDAPASEPRPKLRLGESYTNVFGHVVTRLTDTGAAHFYTDRSPLNADSSLLVYASMGGGQQRMMRVATGEHWAIAEANDARSYSPSYWWDSKDPDKLYWAAERGLWSYQPSTKLWTRMAPLLIGVPGYLNIAGYANGRFLLDLRAQSKDSRGMIMWEARQAPQVYLGSTIKAAPKGMWFTGGGLSPDGQYVASQVNGLAPNPSTLTYISRWDDNPLDSPSPLIRGVVTGHGCMGKAAHVRLIYSAESAGWLPSEVADGSPNWLASVRLADLSQQGHPFRELFVWPPRRFQGMHVGCSDTWATLSTYYEGAPPMPEAKPFSNEIVLVSMTSEATATGAPATIKQGEFRRIAFHHSSGATYWAQPHAVESIDGRYVIFTSDMAGQPDVYAVKIK